MAHYQYVIWRRHLLKGVLFLHPDSHPTPFNFTRTTNFLSTMSEKPNTNFPVLPTEEQIKAGVFDKKRDENSGTPDAQEYRTQPITTEALPEHFQAAPGPVIPQDTSIFENKLSREEILAKTAELNKKG